MPGESLHRSREKLKMLFPSREQQRRPACFQGTPQVCGDQRVLCRILDQRGIDILNRQVCHLSRHLEISVPRDHLVLEGRGFGHRPRAHVKADRTALHIDDRMMTILARRRSGQTDQYLAFTCFITARR